MALPRGTEDLAWLLPSEYTRPHRGPKSRPSQLAIPAPARQRPAARRDVRGRDSASSHGGREKPLQNRSGPVAPAGRSWVRNKGTSGAFKNRSGVSFLIGFKSPYCSRVPGGVFPEPTAPRGISRVVAGHTAGRLEIHHVSPRDWLDRQQHQSTPSRLRSSLQEATGRSHIPWGPPL